VRDTYRFEEQAHTFYANRRDRLIWNAEPDTKVRNIDTPTHYAKIYKRNTQPDLIGGASEGSATSLRVEDVWTVGTARRPVMHRIGSQTHERDSAQDDRQKEAHRLSGDSGTSLNRIFRMAVCIAATSGSYETFVFSTGAPRSLNCGVPCRRSATDAVWPNVWRQWRAQRSGASPLHAGVRQPAATRRRLGMGAVPYMCLARNNGEGVGPEFVVRLREGVKVDATELTQGIRLVVNDDARGAEQHLEVGKRRDTAEDDRKRRGVRASPRALLPHPRTGSEHRARR